MSKSAVLKKYLAPKFMDGGGEVAPPGGREVDENEDPGLGEAASAPLNSNSDASSVSAPIPLSEDQSSIVGAIPPATEALPASSAPSDADKQAAMAAYLQKQYGAAADPSKVNEAVGDSKKANLIAGLGRAFQQIAQAKGVAHGLQADNSAWDAIEKHGQQGVARAQEERKQNIQDFMQRHELGRQLSQDMMAKGSFDQKMEAGQFSLKHERDLQDPQSEASKQAVALAHAQFPDIFKGLTDDQKANLSYNDIKNIGLPATEVASKDKMTLEAARARLSTQLAEKDKQADTAFVGSFGKLSQEHNKAASKLDEQGQMLQQAAQSGGGIAGALVKGGALHEALGRVSQGELGMAVDPSIVERAKRLYGSLAEGKTVTDADVKEYQAIQGAAKASLEERWQKDADLATSSYDRARHAPAGYAAGMVGYKGPGEQQSSSPPPPAQQPDVSAYAAKHGISYDAALQIKNARTGAH